MGLLAVGGLATGDIFGGETHIQLGTAVTVASVVVVATWRLSSWMRGISDSIALLNKKFDSLPCGNCQPEKRKGSTR